MRTENLLGKNIGSDYQVRDSLGQGGDLLRGLEERVSHALKINDVLKINPIDALQIKNYMAEISPTPLPGMVIQNTVV